jgi:colanic acid/amylovoran biosynthesis glycosyltransferase
MKKKVAHFIRNVLSPHVTFVRNQVMNHANYVPCVVGKKYIPSDFAQEIVNSVPTFICDRQKRGISHAFSSVVYARPFRRVTLGDRREIRRFLSSQRADILHFHYGTDAGVFVGATRDLGIPRVVSFYGYDCTSFPNWFFGYGGQYLRKVFKQVDYCVAMSEDMKADLLGLGCPKSKIFVHYYGTEVSKFVYKRAYNNKPNITILIVASLDEKKGHIYLLKSLEKLTKAFKFRLRLRIVGCGPLGEELKNYVKSCNLENAVTFVGAHEYLGERFLKEFHDADIFAHPSVIASNGDKEGIPGTIVEAMAAGLPVVSTYHAGIPYILEHEKTGLLVKERDVDALAASISRLVLDSELRKRIGQNAQKYALKHLDLRQKQVELENIYDRVIEEFKTRA